jgi:hypothetical protein
MSCEAGWALTQLPEFLVDGRMTDLIVLWIDFAVLVHASRTLTQTFASRETLI